MLRPIFEIKCTSLIVTISVIPRDQNSLLVQRNAMWLLWILMYTNVTKETHASCNVPILK